MYKKILLMEIYNVLLATTGKKVHKLIIAYVVDIIPVKFTRN